MKYIFSDTPRFLCNKIVTCYIDIKYSTLKMLKCTTTLSSFSISSLCHFYCNHNINVQNFSSNSFFCHLTQKLHKMYTKFKKILRGTWHSVLINVRRPNLRHFLSVLSQKKMQLFSAHIVSIIQICAELKRVFYSWMDFLAYHLILVGF